jgi:ATP dependent DNA ligase domain
VSGASVTPLLGHKIRHGQAMERSSQRRPALLPVGFVKPCLPSVRPTAPRGREWVHEIKHDGYRLIMRRDGKRARVFTRRGFDWTGRFPWIEDAVCSLWAQSATIDGEAVVCGNDGISFSISCTRGHTTIRCSCMRSICLNSTATTGELVAQFRANLLVALADVATGCGEAFQVRDGLYIPNNDVAHGPAAKFARLRSSSTSTAEPEEILDTVLAAPTTLLAITGGIVHLFPRAVYRDADARRKDGGWEPSSPLILNAWWRHPMIKRENAWVSISVGRPSMLR